MYRKKLDSFLKQEPRVITEPEKELPLTAIGISNILLAHNKTYATKEFTKLYNSKDRHFFNVQFYDFDGHPTDQELEKILEIFYYDCIEYTTNQGHHFISFACLQGKARCLKKAIRLSERLGQDYAMETNLVLRISEKWLNGVAVRERPKFKKIHKPPVKHLIISKRHLEIYKNFLKLPKFAVDLYERQQCRIIDGKVRLYRYRTRNKKDEDDRLNYDTDQWQQEQYDYDYEDEDYDDYRGALDGW